jgi:hypothetical protein
MAHVPDTGTFTLQNVTNAVRPIDSSTLVESFADSIDALFNATYKGSKDRMSNFRDYGYLVFYNTYKTGSTDYLALATDNTYIYCACGTEGIRVYSFGVDNSTLIYMTGRNDLGAGESAVDICYGGGFVFVAKLSGILVYEYTGGTLYLRDDDESEGTNFESVLENGGYVYIGGRLNEFSLLRAYTYNASGVLTFYYIQTAGSINTRGGYKGICLSDSKIYSTDSSGYIERDDLPPSVLVATVYSGSSYYTDVDSNEDYNFLFCSTIGNGIETYYYTTTPSFTYITKKTSESTDFNGLYVLGTLLFACNGKGLFAYDINTGTGYLTLKDLDKLGIYHDVYATEAAYLYAVGSFGIATYGLNV